MLKPRPDNVTQRPEDDPQRIRERLEVILSRRDLLKNRLEEVLDTLPDSLEKPNEAITELLRVRPQRHQSGDDQTHPSEHAREHADQPAEAHATAYCAGHLLCRTYDRAKVRNDEPDHRQDGRERIRQERDGQTNRSDRQNDLRTVLLECLSQPFDHRLDRIQGPSHNVRQARNQITK